MADKVNYNKSITMDYVYKELTNIVSTLIVKKQYMADRYDTVESLRAADDYIAAIEKADLFISYENYSIYALHKAGLYDEQYQKYKYNIPEEKRQEVLSYQREYIIANYEEPNNYYRALAGLPDIGDDYIYITEVTDQDIEGIDKTKPIHEMTKSEATILKVYGIIDKLIEKYPKKEYLKHIDYEYKIDIVTARKSLDFDILYIKKDRSKQGVADYFIGIYRQTREYVMDRFYDDTYKKDSPYYDAFIGLFILCITIQRYITNYIQKFINRDFYDKDIIKLLFESYGIPFYDDIPLAYLQKVCKNLNRLLYYKATDRVFTDIFKIFDMDNIDVYNYILFKDRDLDVNGKPIEIYKEKTELGYQIDTKTYTLTNTNDFYGIKVESFENVKKILYINDCIVCLHNNGIVNFYNMKDNLLDGFKYELDEDKSIKFMHNMNISDIEEIEGKNVHKIILRTEQPNLFYTFNNINKLTEETFDLSYFDNSKIEKVLICADKAISNMYVGIVTSDGKGRIYAKGTLLDAYFEDYTLIHETEFGINYLAGNYGSIILIDKNYDVFVYGDNTNNRLHVPNKKEITTFEDVSDRIYEPKEAFIFYTGTLFVMLDGTVRITGSIPEISDINTTPGDNEILQGYSGIKTLQIWKADKNVYFLIQYDGTINIINYTPNDIMGPLLFKADVAYPIIRYKYIKNLTSIPNGIMITVYDTDSFVHYSGKTGKLKFPFIKSDSLLTETNERNMKEVEVYNDVMYFVDKDNTIYQYLQGEYYEISLPTKENIQRFIQTNNNIVITVGKKYFYLLNQDYGVVKVNTDLDVIKDLIIDQDNMFLYTITDEIYQISVSKFNLLIVDNEIQLDKLKLTKVEYYTCTHYDENKSITLIPKVENNILNFYISYKNDEKNIIRYCKVKNLYNCRRICISNDRVYIEGKYFQYLNISEIEDSNSVTNGVEAYYYDEIDYKRAYSERIENTVVIYNRSGGFTIFTDFPHLDKLDSYVEGEYLSLYDDQDSYIQDIAFDDTDIIFIEESNKVITYEPVVEKMYNLKFIEAPIDTKNLAEQFVNPENYLDYDLVVSDDNLWGGDGDQEAFLNEVLNSEFNYVTSKYISIDCRYEITQLNFEVCYMFRLLTDLKVNEEYLVMDVPYVGKVKLFDCIVGLFALTCKKFGFDGNIMDTTTKTLSVLGFNFKQDMDYIRNVVESAKLDERTYNFKIENIEIKQPPAIFLDSPEVINNYLDNMDVVQSIYDYKYNAKTIKEYNAYKRIQEATVYTRYTTDMYRKSDGTLPLTYLEYIKVANPELYLFIQETTDENMIEQIDNLLMALDKYMATDKFKFLFLNIPSLSLDSIRQFIYYLVDIFKSYTVELKAMNIIYHVDDKRIHNIKLLLQEKDFKKYFRNYTKYEIEDAMDYALCRFDSYTQLKLDMINNPKGKFTFEELGALFKYYEILLDKTDERRLSLLADFADVFDTMDESWSIDKKMELIDKAFRESLLPVLEKGLKNIHNKVEFLYSMSRKDVYEIITKMTPIDKITFKEKILLNLKKQLYSLDVYKYEKTIIKINDLLNDYNKLYDNRDVLPFDFCDQTESQSKLIQQNNKIKFKEYIYFERNE